MTRYRRNIDCLSDDELHDLRETLTAMYQIADDDVLFEGIELEID